MWTFFMIIGNIWLSLGTLVTAILFYLSVSPVRLFDFYQVTKTIGNPLEITKHPYSHIFLTMGLVQVHH